MTKEELDNWIKSAKFITYENDDYDSCGNHEVTKIFEKDGKFWAIHYQNNYPYEKWSNKGFIRGQYAEPHEVFKKTRIIEYYDYE